MVGIRMNAFLSAFNGHFLQWLSKLFIELCFNPANETSIAGRVSTLEFGGAEDNF